MVTYVIRSGSYPQLAPGHYEWTAVIAADGAARPHAVHAVERYGRTRIEHAQSSKPLAADVMASVRREPGMTRAALIEMRLHRS